MTRLTARAVVHASALERCLSGTVLLGAHGTVARLIAGDQARPPAWLIRILAVRLLTQGLLEYTRPSRAVVLAGAAVDTAHAATMIAATLLRPAYRRIAIASAGEAALSAALSALIARRLP